jgi:hypothetical protein
MPLTRRATFAPPSEVDRNERAASWKSCPLPGTTLGRTTPAAGRTVDPPTEGSAMRLVKLVITRPTERAAEDDGRRRLTCPP